MKLHTGWKGLVIFWLAVLIGAILIHIGNQTLIVILGLPSLIMMSYGYNLVRSYAYGYSD